MARGLRFLLCLLGLGLLTAGCPAHTSAGRDPTEEGEVEGERESGSEGEGGAEGESGAVKLRHRPLRDAVVEDSDTGRPRHDPGRLRRALCEGYQDQPRIFYHLTVSIHWHYYWICSDDRPHRASSLRGKRNLDGWLKGFKKQAALQSRHCTGAGERKALTGNHESGIQAVAYCDGRIVLGFPDGGQTQTNFQSQARQAAVRNDPPPEDPGGGSGEGDTVTRDCPPCPTPPPVRGGRCPECPVCAVCPPPRSCPPPRACPPPAPCDCGKAALEAGQKAFRQGVDKACKRICDLVYKKCRSINPNTALCYQLSEYCATECIR